MTSSSCHDSSLVLPALHSFPTRRSSDLKFCRLILISRIPFPRLFAQNALIKIAQGGLPVDHFTIGVRGNLHCPRGKGKDRKSTRLDSSHVATSYAVFCLEEKRRE